LAREGGGGAVFTSPRKPPSRGAISTTVIARLRCAANGKQRAAENKDRDFGGTNSVETL
jgi:hypothetical protein